MGVEIIKKEVFYYKTLYRYVNWAFRKYFVVQSFGLDNLKEGEAYIFAPNHQNALIDPLAIIVSYKPRMLFYARADIFKKKIIANFLHSLRMLPVFRIRDGYDQIKKNREIFDLTLEVVAEGNGLVVFPEANHFGQRRLRALKKGLVRVAFQSQLKYPNKKIYIVPVGIEYSHYHFFNSELNLYYSKPIAVDDFIEHYKSNDSKALIDLNSRLKDELSKSMIDIKYSDERYNSVETLIDVQYNSMLSDGEIKVDSLKNRVELAQSINQIDFDDKSDILKEANNYLESLKKHKLKDKDLLTTSGLNFFLSIFILIVLLPLALFSFVFNYPPYLISKLSRISFEDKQFFATMQFVVSALFSFPLFYSVYLWQLSTLFEGNVIISFSLLLALFYSIYPLASYSILVEKIYRKIVVLAMKQSDKNNILNLRSKLMASLTNLMKNK